MTTPNPAGLEIEASDVSMQKTVRVRDLQPDHTVGELVQALIASMKLPQTDASGRPLTFHARLEREGRSLHASESVGTALQTGDRLVLQPNIDAGFIG